MIKQLRTKFVCIMMSFVVIMLVAIFAMVIFLMGMGLEMQADRMMDALSEDPIRMEGRMDPLEEIRVPYFIVQVSRRGEITAIGRKYYDLSDEKTVQEQIQLALNSNRQEGFLEEYDLRFKRLSTPAGEMVIFADISSQRSTMNSLIVSCIIIGCISIVVFLLISLLLANWAVGPVEQAWQQQKQFVADASHELKTPLSVIMTNAELLQNPEYDETARRQFSDNIFTMSHQMRRLVEGLLDLARVDNGAVKMAFTDVDMSVLAEEGILPFEPLYFEKGLCLSAELEAGILLHGSPAHLKQVLDILLDNALKYTSPGGNVWVRLKRQGSSCILCVANEGVPISPQDLQNIFRRFYRLDKVRSRNGSYGLGLAIAKSIAEDHRGRILAESQNGINIFSVQLPMK